MIYEYACDICDRPFSVEKGIGESAKPEYCPCCKTLGRRLFAPISLLGRSKPRGFKWDKGKLNGWDDRVATLRDIEGKGPGEFRKFKESIGGTLYNATLRYKKEAHG